MHFSNSVFLDLRKHIPYAPQAEDPFAASSEAAMQLAPAAHAPPRVLDYSDGITAAIPGLATLVEEDEADLKSTSISGDDASTGALSILIQPVLMCLRVWSCHMLPVTLRGGIHPNSFASEPAACTMAEHKP